MNPQRGRVSACRVKRKEEMCEMGRGDSFQPHINRYGEGGAKSPRRHVSITWLILFLLPGSALFRVQKHHGWNHPTRSRDGASSSDDNSHTGPDHPDRDRGATPPRTTADRPCAVRAQSVRSHAVTSFPFSGSVFNPEWSNKY